MADPSTTEWRAALAHSTVTNSWDTASTAAQLREAQAALAASQADLTAMQQRYEEARAEAREMRAQADHWLTKLRETAAELAAARHRNRILTAENESALRRLNEQRNGGEQ